MTRIGRSGGPAGAASSSANFQYIAAEAPERPQGTAMETSANTFGSENHASDECSRYLASHRRRTKWVCGIDEGY